MEKYLSFRVKGARYQSGLALYLQEGEFINGPQESTLEINWITCDISCSDSCRNIRFILLNRVLERIKGGTGAWE